MRRPRAPHRPEEKQTIGLHIYFGKWERPVLLWNLAFVSAHALRSWLDAACICIYERAAPALLGPEVAFPMGQ